MTNRLLTARNINVLGATNYRQRQRFINRMQRKLKVKEVLYPDGDNHRFAEPTQLDLRN